MDCDSSRSSDSYRMNINFSKVGNYFDTGAIDPLSHVNSSYISSGLWVWRRSFVISKGTQGIALGFVFGIMVASFLFGEEFMANVSLDVWLNGNGVSSMVAL